VVGASGGRVEPLNARVMWMRLPGYPCMASAYQALEGSWLVEVARAHVCRSS
jgi:hypothetical protein